MRAGDESQAAARLRVVARFACLWGLVLVGRLIWLQVVEHEEYARQARQQQQRRIEIRAPRGEILDRNGERLAMSLPVDSACINPLRIPDHAVAADILSRVLGVDREELLVRTKEAVDARKGFLWVKRKLSPEESARLRSLNLDWVEFRTESRRFYPKGPLAAHVIGSVDHEEKGNAGIELALNEDLQGKPGIMRTTSDVRGGVVDSVVFTDPQPGKRIQLTIDERIQHVAQSELRRAVIENRCTTGSVVVMKPDTGEVLAIANAWAKYEPFDPNVPPAPGESLENRSNLAIAAPFEPGSVFKVITLATAFDTTNLRPDNTFHCGNGRMTLFRRVIHDAHPYGVLSAADILAKSSNIGAIQIGLKVGDERMYEFVRKFGFGKATGVPLPGESAGLTWPLKKWIASSIGSIAMGHELLTTTLQLGQACSVIANGGTLVRPTLVLSTQRPGGDAERSRTAEPVRVIRPETAALMRGLMQGVVLHGTGTRAQLRGYSSAGKTGSAQIYDHATRTYTHKYNASFMGFAPVNRPAIVVVVTLNGASKYGGAVSAPVFERIASAALRLLDVPKDMPDVEPDRTGEPDTDLSIAELGMAPEGELPVVAQMQAQPAAAPAQAVVFGPAPPPVPYNPPGPDRQTVVHTGPLLPNFAGKTLRDVFEESTALGIKVEYKGTGIARLQEPAPGTPVRPGDRVRVLFAR